MRVFALLLLILGSATANAQLSNIVPGTRVRIETRNRALRFQGTVVSHNGDSIVVANGGVHRTVVATSSIFRAQASQGKSHASGAIKGAKIGAPIGAGAAQLLFLGYALVSAAWGGDVVFADYVVGTGGYAIAGAIVGLAVGGVVRAEKWTTMYSQPYRLGVAVTRTGTPAFGLSLAF